MAVIIYAKRENVKYFSIFTYFLYGTNISAAEMNPVNSNVRTKNGSWGITSLTAAPIAPMSVPMFLILAIRSKLASGKTTLLEYFLLITTAKPSPVIRPILAQIY